MKRWRVRPPWLCRLGGRIAGIAVWMAMREIPRADAVLRLGCWCTNLWQPDEDEIEGGDRPW